MRHSFCRPEDEMWECDDNMLRSCSAMQRLLDKRFKKNDAGTSVDAPTKLEQKIKAKKIHSREIVSGRRKYYVQLYSCR
eukprot:COSAG01_NODE_9716_length_2363_cov_3.365283_2_plen_79_part_00